MHHFLQTRNNGVCHFVTEAVTVECFPMVIATKYNVPIVLYRPETGNVRASQLILYLF